MDLESIKKNTRSESKMISRFIEKIIQLSDQGVIDRLIESSDTGQAFLTEVMKNQLGMINKSLIPSEHLMFIELGFMLAKRLEQLNPIMKVSSCDFEAGIFNHVLDSVIEPNDLVADPVLLKSRIVNSVFSEICNQVLEALSDSAERAEISKFEDYFLNILVYHSTQVLQAVKMSNNRNYIITSYNGIEYLRSRLSVNKSLSYKELYYEDPIELESLVQIGEIDSYKTKIFDIYVSDSLELNPIDGSIKFLIGNKDSNAELGVYVPLMPTACIEEIKLISRYKLKVDSAAYKLLILR